MPGLFCLMYFVNTVINAFIIYICGMTATRKPLNPIVYILLIGFSLVIAITLLYINFSDFVMPFGIVVALLAICALTGLGSYIGYLRLPVNDLSLAAKIWRTTLVVLLGIVVTILLALPVLVFENA